MQKRQSSQQCCLALLRPIRLKAAHKMLMKLTPGDVEEESDLGVSCQFGDGGRISQLQMRALSKRDSRVNPIIKFFKKLLLY